jgi:hypothetical protein
MSPRYECILAKNGGREETSVDDDVDDFLEN